MFFRLVHAPLVDLGCLPLDGNSCGNSLSNATQVDLAMRAIYNWTHSHIIRMDLKQVNHRQFLSRLYARAVMAFTYNYASASTWATFRRSRIWNLSEEQVPRLYRREGEYIVRDLVTFVAGTHPQFISHGIFFAKCANKYAAIHATEILC